MESSKKGVLINASWGAWYPKGTDRLARSMIYHGWNYDIKLWVNEKINEIFDGIHPYRIKAAALKEAVSRGYTHILWMDCSLWVVRDPNVLMEIIDSEGGLFIKSGYNLAQTSGDKDLQWAGWTRNSAQLFDEVWSCMFGINLETEQGRNFYAYFIAAVDAGVFDTPREHGGLSDDPRFLHARQDQTAATIAYHKSGFERPLREPWELLSPYVEKDKYKDTVVLMRGM